MPTRGNPLVQARLPRALYDAFRAKAGNDLSRAVRHAVAEYVDALPSRVSPRMPRAPRKPTRLERLERLREAAQALLEEYEDWRTSLPENLSTSVTAERLTETVEQLEQVADLLGAVEPPRGFGRD